MVMKPAVILFLAANAAESMELKLNEEYHAIDKEIQSSEYRELLKLAVNWSARPDDLLQSLNRYRPTILHFSGHGSTTGELMLLDDSGVPKRVSKKALKSFFKIARKHVRVVVLNACYTRALAKAIAEDIDCVIGMNAAIGDRAATVFSTSFYGAVGFGRSVGEAFDQGIAALQLRDIPEENTPKLIFRRGIRPSRVFPLPKPRRVIAAPHLGLEHPKQLVGPSGQILNYKDLGSGAQTWMQLPAGFLLRRRLTTRVNKAMHNSKCVILCSGPGTGKSVLLAQIARKLESRCIFYRCQSTGRDIAPFLFYLIDRLGRYFPEKSNQLKTLTDVLAQGLGNREAVPLLISKFLYQQGDPRAIYVVVDDYHYITEDPDRRVREDFDQVLRILVGQTPSFFKFLIASRSELPTFTSNTSILRNIGLEKVESKKLVAKLGLAISDATIEFLYKMLDGSFLLWRTAIGLAKKRSLTERKLLTVVSRLAEASHE